MIDEVENALKSMDSYTVLLKGAPGTGKTTYAITLLEKLCQDDTGGVYISTRIDPTVLYKQFPGLESRIPARSIIDATQSEFSESEYQVLYEDVMSFLRSVYGLVAEEDVKILIIDSWDAVSFQIGRDNNVSAEKLEISMLDIARKTKTRLLLITEYSESRKLDYLVDGVVRLDKEVLEGRTVRKLRIDKLRGFLVPHTSYPFTLEAGRFTRFGTTAGELGSGRHRLIKRNSKSSYSTGMKDLDMIIGGYPRGSFVLLEIADDSLSQSYRPVLFHTIANFLLNDNGVVYMPEEGYYSSSVKQLLREYVDEEVLTRHLRMPTISPGESTDPCLFQIDRADSLESYMEKHLDICDTLKKPVLHVIGLSMLSTHPEEEMRKMLSEMVSLIRTTEDVLIGILKPSTKLKNEIREMADVHLRFVPISGTINVYGIKPYTILYNIAPMSTNNAEYHQLKFTPFL